MAALDLRIGSKWSRAPSPSGIDDGLVHFILQEYRVRSRVAVLRSVLDRAVRVEVSRDALSDRSQWVAGWRPCSKGPSDDRGTAEPR